MTTIQSVFMAFFPYLNGSMKIIDRREEARIDPRQATPGSGTIRAAKPSRDTGSGRSQEIAGERIGSVRPDR
jgi:hypothetical protein